MKKYKEVFKTWGFWWVVAILFFVQILRNVVIYKSLFLAEILGILIGSFVFCCFCYGIIFFIKKSFKKEKVKKQ